jgi:protein TonB
MANDLLNPPQNEVEDAAQNGRVTSPSFGSTLPSTDGHELDAFLGKAFEEKSVFADLFENVHDLFFPVKLPPLELTSTPIPVPDRMAVKRSPASVAISAAVNGGILALLLFAFRNQIANVVKSPALSLIDPNVSAWKPITPKSGNIGCGGGGGNHDIVPVSKGHLPKLDTKPIIQPQAQTVKDPIIPVVPAIDVQKYIKLPDNPNLPNIGAFQSTNNVVLSNGSGSGGGMGTGTRGGLGSGNGNGLGPGEGGNTGGGLRRVGDGVSAPKAIFQPEAEFSDEARRAKYEGTVVVTLIVDANGNPQNVHVTRTLGMGLDEKAVEAVQKYKFKPAVDQKTGKGVPVMVSVEVRFRLY